MADRDPHARHDRFAIAEAVGGGHLPSTIGTCRSCGALHADLLAIRAAVRAAWLPGRPRDFLLTAIEAARLRPARWRRILAAIGTSRDAITRPIALSVTGLGLAGLVLTAVPIGSPEQATAELLSAGAPTRTPPASVEPLIGIEGEPHAAPGRRDLATTPAGSDPLTALSAGLLAAGGALFLLRRVAPRAGGVR